MMQVTPTEIDFITSESVNIQATIVIAVKILGINRVKPERKALDAVPKITTINIHILKLLIIFNQFIASSILSSPKIFRYLQQMKDSNILCDLALSVFSKYFFLFPENLLFKIFSLSKLLINSEIFGSVAVFFHLEPSLVSQSYIIYSQFSLILILQVYLQIKFT